MFFECLLPPSAAEELCTRGIEDRKPGDLCPVARPGLKGHYISFSVIRGGPSRVRPFSSFRGDAVQFAPNLCGDESGDRLDGRGQHGLCGALCR